jgi:butyryl-CoA dehydrogenase
MRFELNEEQKMMQKMVREFADKMIAPGAAQRDAEEKFDRGLYDAAVELGLNGICFPEEYGGAGGDHLSYTVALEELSRADGAFGGSFATTVSLCQWPILQFGTEQQKRKYLVPLIEGKTLGAFGLTEPNAGTDAGAQETTAVRDGSNYILNGSKIFITNGGEAETYVLFAMTDKTRGVKGISAFILEKGMPGFSFGKKERKMGQSGNRTVELIFQDVKLPAENLLGKEGEGFKIAMAAIDGGRIGIAAQGLGIAQAALDHALKYSKERVQFGKPIASNQAIAFMLADMATKVEASRLLVYRAAYLKDQGLPYSKESAMAKLYATDTAMEVTTDAVQIFGGYGYSREYPVERLMRDAKVTQIYEGTNQVQRMIISGAILR